LVVFTRTRTRTRTHRERIAGGLNKVEEVIMALCYEEAGPSWTAMTEWLPGARAHDAALFVYS
jgi:hypothetical protein